MDTSKNEISTKDLVFHIIMKVMWLGIAMGITYIVYNLSIELLFVELGLTSNLWVLVSGLVSFVVGNISNGLYDTAFD